MNGGRQASGDAFCGTPRRRSEMMSSKVGEAIRVQHIRGRRPHQSRVRQTGLLLKLKKPIREFVLKDQSKVVVPLGLFELLYLR